MKNMRVWIKNRSKLLWAYLFEIIVSAAFAFSFDCLGGIEFVSKFLNSEKGIVVTIALVLFSLTTAIYIFFISSVHNSEFGELFKV